MRSRVFLAALRPGTRPALLLEGEPPGPESESRLTLAARAGQFKRANEILKAVSAPFRRRVRSAPDEAVMLVDQASIEEDARRIHARAYDSPDAIRAGNGWYRTMRQDIADLATYAPLDTPIRTLAGESSYPVRARTTAVDTWPGLVLCARTSSVGNFEVPTFHPWPGDTFSAL